MPEDWDNPESTPNTITYVRQFSTSESPFAEPILYFHSGPGGTVLGSLGTHNFDFPFLRNTRDIIFFDQRGNRFRRDLRCPTEVATPDIAAAEQTPPPPGVSSDARTLILNGTLDTSTPVSQGDLAFETLTNAEMLTLHRSGHGTTRYTDCAQDIVNAFVMYPNAAFERSCVDALSPTFVLPEDALPTPSAE